jgi:hypothetical protein
MDNGKNEKEKLCSKLSKTKMKERNDDQNYK